MGKIGLVGSYRKDSPETTPSPPKFHDCHNKDLVAKESVEYREWATVCLYCMQGREGSLWVLGAHMKVRGYPQELVFTSTIWSLGIGLTLSNLVAGICEHRTGDWTQDFGYAKHILYHWAISPTWSEREQDCRSDAGASWGPNKCSAPNEDTSGKSTTLWPQTEQTAAWFCGQ